MPSMMVVQAADNLVEVLPAVSEACTADCILVTRVEYDGEGTRI